jgi:hypothetical protein
MDELKIMISCGDTSLLLSRYIELEDNETIKELLAHLEKEVNWFFLMKDNDDVTTGI